MNIFNFFTEQVLGMKWLSNLITFSFLISSPMVDVASLLLLAGFFGMNISILYVVLGLIIAIIGGTIISNCSKIEKQFPGSIAVGSFKFWKYNGFTRL